MDPMAQAIWRKLSSRIVASSIWRESMATKVVWITMIAMADQDGVVHASVGGLADLARVSRDECKEALAVLLSPDEDDSSQVAEGRRLEPVKGGWKIINFEEYQELEKLAARRESKAAWMRKKRASAGASTVDSGVHSGHVDDRREDKRREEEEETATRSSAPSRKPITEQRGLVGDLAREWSVACSEPGKPPRIPAWGRAVIEIGKLANRHGEAEVRAAWARFLASEDPFYTGKTAGQFIAHFDRFRFDAKPAARPAPQGRLGKAAPMRDGGMCANDVPAHCGHAATSHGPSRKCSECPCEWYIPPKKTIRANSDRPEAT